MRKAFTQRIHRLKRCLSVCLSLGLSVSVSVCLCVCLSLCLCVSVFVCLCAAFACMLVTSIHACTNVQMLVLLWARTYPIRVHTHTRTCYHACSEDLYDDLGIYVYRKSVIGNLWVMIIYYWKTNVCDTGKKLSVFDSKMKLKDMKNVCA